MTFALLFKFWATVCFGCFVWLILAKTWAAQERAAKALFLAMVSGLLLVWVPL